MLAAPWRLSADFALIYLVLLATYATVGLLVELGNRRLVSNLKIQSRSPSDRLARRDAMQSVVSLAQIALFLTLGIDLRSLVVGPWIWNNTPLAFAGGLLISLFLFDTWFYWGHRLLHTNLLYRRIHQWHHTTITPTVWSNNSDTFLDNCFLQSYWLFAPLLLPFPTWVFLVHKLFDQVSGMIGHSGYEYNAASAQPPSPLLAVTHHDQHHRYFKYNFATHFIFWDRWMHTLHPDYDRIMRSLASRTSAPRSQAATGDEPGLSAVSILATEDQETRQKAHPA